jgi:hypothetical protein
MERWHQRFAAYYRPTDDSAIMDFLLKYAGGFDMYVEDEWFEPKRERLRLAG